MCLALLAEHAAIKPKPQMSFPAYPNLVEGSSSKQMAFVLPAQQKTWKTPSESISRSARSRYGSGRALKSYLDGDVD
jgi:hypothetical protein